MVPHADLARRLCGRLLVLRAAARQASRPNRPTCARWSPAAWWTATPTSPPSSSSPMPTARTAMPRKAWSWMLDTVNRSMRMSTLMTSTLQILSGVLIFTMSAMSIWLWYNGCHHHRRHRLRHRPDAAHQGHVAVDHLGSGRPVRGCRRHPGRHRDHRARPHHQGSPRTPSRWSSAEGEIRFENVTFNYGKRRPARGRAGARQPDAHHRAGREGGPRRAFRRGQVDARQSAAALLRPRSRAAS